MDAAEILATYDRQVRQSVQVPVPGWAFEWTDPDRRIFRGTGPTRGSQAAFISYTDLDESTVDQAVAEQVAYFAELGGHSEWKLYGHDRPPDLGARLEAAGLVPEDVEAFVVGSVDGVLAAGAGVEAPGGVTVRMADSAEDFAGIGAMHSEVWGEDDAWLGDELAAELAAAPDLMDVYVAIADGRVVSAGWIRYLPGSDFGGLYGGSTLEAWRHRGIYRALVDIRARRAKDRGISFLQVDASVDSEPILARLGLVKLDWTRPYNWRRSAAASGAGG